MCKVCILCWMRHQIALILAEFGSVDGRPGRVSYPPWWLVVHVVTRGLLLYTLKVGYRAHQRNRTVEHRGDAGALPKRVGLQSFLTLITPESRVPRETTVAS